MMANDHGGVSHDGVSASSSATLYPIAPNAQFPTPPACVHSYVAMTLRTTGLTISQ
jgi:hypothetical protein